MIDGSASAVWNRLRDSDTSYGYNLYGPTEYTINTLGGGTDDSGTPTRCKQHTLGYWLAHPLTGDDLRGLRAIYG